MAMETESIELPLLADIMIDSKLEIDSWEVIIKEHQGHKQLKKLIEELSISHTVVKKENENSIIYSVKDTHKKSNLIVSYNAVIPKDRQYKPELVVTIKGDSWEGDIQSSFLNIYFDVRSEYFTKEAKIFSCMSSRPSAIINDDYIVESFTEKLKIRYLTTEKDNLKSTRNIENTYGYTALWSRNITIQDKPVNVQIVMKDIGNGDVQYMIGTPILINEY